AGSTPEVYVFEEQNLAVALRSTRPATFSGLLAAASIAAMPPVDQPTIHAGPPDSSSRREIARAYAEIALFCQSSPCSCAKSSASDNALTGLDPRIASANGRMACAPC